MYLAITKWDAENRISKSQDFKTLELAEAFVEANIQQYPESFTVDFTGEDVCKWVVDNVTKTISYDPDVETYKPPLINAINDLRDEKKNLPILTEGYEVQTGTQNVGAMATDMFAASKNSLIVDSLTSAGNVATLTFTKPHHQKEGCSFPVSGADQSEYNITAVATPINPHSLTYPITGPAVSPATGTISVGTPSFKWVDNNNNIVFWTQEEVQEIAQACAEYLDECMLHGVELKNEVRSCTSVAEIEAINIMTGWPDTGL